MRRWIAGFLLAICALGASAAKKETGTTTLKDVQPAGTTDTKDQKKQLYDFSFRPQGTVTSAGPARRLR